MLQFFLPEKRALEVLSEKVPFSEEAIWYDLFYPEVEEIQLVEEKLKLHIPTLDEMHEIEASSRLYTEEDSLYMTANIVASGDSEIPSSTPITFILHHGKLITVRYSDPKSFLIFHKRLKGKFKFSDDARFIFLGLLEAIVDRMADILEMTLSAIDVISKEVFQTKRLSLSVQTKLNEIIMELGKKNDINTKVRESLENIFKLLNFFGHQVEDPPIHTKIQVLRQDVSSIASHLTFLTNKIKFLLDATIGLIGIEQNAIIKILSVAAVIFLPPTLIASIYGMNFIEMPELHWVAGYPFALLVMIFSSVIPYLYFKRRGWL